MDEDLERVKKRIEKRLEQYESDDHQEEPFNDAMDHLGRIEGYPTQNLSKVNMKSFPLPIRILGYFLFGAMGLGALAILISLLIYKLT